MPRKSKADKEREAAADKGKEPPITMGEPTEDNPSGIEAVSEDAAKKFGQSRDTGGPGAAGATVGGPIAHVATDGGTKPLPVDDPPAGGGEDEKPDDDDEKPDED